VELAIQLPEGAQRLAITGPAERNLKIIREALGVTIIARDGSLRLRGHDRAVAQAAHVVEQLAAAAGRGESLDRHGVLELVAAIDALPTGVAARQSGALQLAGGMSVYLPGKHIKPATAGQRHYLDAIEAHDLTFCTGPAGTGKTYLAVAAATVMLKRGHMRKLVLVRPAVEAGEKLGFLPGTMQEKVNPYLRPLLDALHDMMPYEQIERFMAADLLEIIPLAFMRGRTLNDAVVILDEAQNATKTQMLMFLTRLGHGSKMIVTGDTSQTDLDDPRDSGLVDAIRKLRRTSGVAMVTLSGSDIVRHALVQRIVEAYEVKRKKLSEADTTPKAD